MHTEEDEPAGGNREHVWCYLPLNFDFFDFLINKKKQKKNVYEYDASSGIRGSNGDHDR